MTTNDPGPDRTPAEKLADLVQQRKTKAATNPHGAIPGRRSSEQSAAARSASKSKPAPRKG